MELQILRCSRVVLFLCLLHTSGCAMMFARDKMPDMTQVYIGAPRGDVEAQLGDPIMDLRADIGQNGSRKCTYKVLVKNPKEADASTASKIRRSFVGFSTYEVLVIYDRTNHVSQVKELRTS